MVLNSGLTMSNETKMARGLCLIAEISELQFHLSDPLPEDEREMSPLPPHRELAKGKSPCPRETETHWSFSPRSLSSREAATICDSSPLRIFCILATLPAAKPYCWLREAVTRSHEGKEEEIR